MKLHFSGKAGHASVQEHFQQSALGAVTYFLENIEQIVEDLKIYKNSQLGLPTFVVTSILSGDEILLIKQPTSLNSWLTVV